MRVPVAGFIPNSRYPGLASETWETTEIATEEWDPRRKIQKRYSRTQRRRSSPPFGPVP